MFRGKDREAAWNYFQAGLLIQMLCSLLGSLFPAHASSPRCVPLLSMQKAEKLQIYSSFNSQASGDRYSGHKVCPTLITVNLPSITGHLRETHKSQSTWLSPPGLFLIPCLSLAEHTVWLFCCCSTSQDLMRSQEKQRTKKTLSSFSKSGNTSADFEKVQSLVCFLSVPLCREPIFLAMTRVKMVGMPHWSRKWTNVPRLSFCPRGEFPAWSSSHYWNFRL